MPPKLEALLSDYRRARLAADRAMVRATMWLVALTCAVLVYVAWQL